MSQQVVMESGKPALTPREREVLHAVSDGSRSQQVADRLCLSPRTVSFHLANAYVKLGVNNRIQAIGEAQKRGEIPKR